MAKDKKSVYFCQNCGYESSKWMGQCPACHQWNTFVEEVVSVKPAASAGGRASEPGRSRLTPQSLSEISLDQGNRITTGIGELDRVLGGGIVKGSLILIGGDPGIGKSTLLLQVCRHVSNRDLPFCFRSAGIFRTGAYMCCMFPERNRCSRLKCALSGSDSFGMS